MPCREALEDGVHCNNWHCNYCDINKTTEKYKMYLLQVDVTRLVAAEGLLPFIQWLQHPGPY